MNTKFIAIMTMMSLLLMGSALACHEKIVVKDDLGTAMPGLTVQLASNCGWGPQTSSTDATGTSTNWAVQSSCTYNASVLAGADGYACTTGSEYNYGQAGTINLVCTPVDDVPEFGVLAALGIVGLAGLFIYRKRQ